jgi:hypothetical protein
MAIKPIEVTTPDDWAAWQAWALGQAATVAGPKGVEPPAELLPEAWALLSQAGYHVQDGRVFVAAPEVAADEAERKRALDREYARKYRAKKGGAVALRRIKHGADGEIALGRKHWTPAALRRAAQSAVKSLQYLKDSGAMSSQIERDQWAVGGEISSPCWEKVLIMYLRECLSHDQWPRESFLKAFHQVEHRRACNARFDTAWTALDPAPSIPEWTQAWSRVVAAQDWSTTPNFVSLQDAWIAELAPVDETAKPIDMMCGDGWNADDYS